MTTKYKSNTYIPELVSKLKKFALLNNFNKSCTDEIGRLLFTLVSQINMGNILEIGTGYGVGSSWIINGLSNDVAFFSIDINEEQIEKVKRMIDRPNINFITGDWKEIIDFGPFKIIFADATCAKREEAEELFMILESRGMLLIDDLTPEEYWPEDWKGKPDRVRDYWLNHAKLIAQEILLTSTQACIIATKLE